MEKSARVCRGPRARVCGGGAALHGAEVGLGRETDSEAESAPPRPRSAALTQEWPRAGRAVSWEPPSRIVWVTVPLVVFGP